MQRRCNDKNCRENILGYFLQLFSTYITASKMLDVPKYYQCFICNYKI